MRLHTKVTVITITIALATGVLLITRPSVSAVEGCWSGTCSGDADCTTGLSCVSGLCVNASCPTNVSDPEHDCICGLCYEGDSGTVIPESPPAAASIKGSVYIDLNENCHQDTNETADGTVNVDLSQTYPQECAYSSTVSDLPTEFTIPNLSCFSQGATQTANFQLLLTYNPRVTDEGNYSFRCDNKDNNAIQQNINGLTPGQTYVLPSLALSRKRQPWIQSYGGGMYLGKTVSENIPSTAHSNVLIYSNSTMSTDSLLIGQSTLSLNQGTSGSFGNSKVSNYTHANTPNSTFAQIKDSLITSGRLEDVIIRARTVNAPSSVDDKNQDTVVIYHVQNANGSSTSSSANWYNGSIDFPTIIIVEGDFTINTNIRLGQNGFLLIAASGDILVDRNVGTPVGSYSPTGLDENLEGVFIAGGDFNVAESNDVMVIHGTVVTGANGSAGEYKSLRTHEENYKYPSDYLIYNPKLILNAPRILSEPIYSWTELRATE